MNKYLALLLVLFFSLSSFAQKSYPLLNEINEYKEQDAKNFPQPNGILFVGSSSLRMWKNLEIVYKDYHAINRGFGGSTLGQAIYYADDIIYPYQPRQIIIYSGENDLAEGASIEVTFDRFKTLFDIIRKKMPNVPIAFISIKPSPSRINLMPQMAATNQLIAYFLAQQTNAKYINVFDAMLQENMQPKSDIFLSDNLHMNEKGYQIWINIITPYLIKK
jgi:lysophospholipase L1-like esterase